jgi:hypothetical protein
VLIISIDKYILARRFCQENRKIFYNGKAGSFPGRLFKSLPQKLPAELVMGMVQI